MALSTTFILSLFFCTIAATTPKPGTVITTKQPTVTTKNSTAVATTPPPLEFDCINGKVNAIINGSGIDLKAVVVDVGKGKMCHISLPNCTWQNMYKKLHVIYDKKETNAKLVAGHPYYYELECKTGYVAKATAVPLTIGATHQPYIHKDFEPKNKQGITIELRKGSKLLTKSESVYIGDLLSLKINGPANSTIIPINCTATDTSYTYLLWDNTTCQSKDEAIMQNNWTISTNSIFINMYAFRFVDSNSVTIECSAYICPSSDATCISEVNHCSGKNGYIGRKRRSSNIESDPLKEYKEETSSVSFNVVDRFDGTNGSEGVFGNINLYLTAALITIVFLGRE